MKKLVQKIKDTLSILDSDKGFTLIELLVVVLIIGILAAIALPQYQMAVYKSRYSTLMDVTNSIWEAEERFYLANDSYTSDLSKLDISLDGCKLSNNKSYCTYDWGLCEVYVDSDYNYDKITCLNTSSMSNGYTKYLGTHRSGYQRVCFAFDDNYRDVNSKYNKVCKELGGELKGQTDMFLSSGNKPSTYWRF